MPNPTVEKLYEGCERARAAEADLILAVGGGSVCDYAKAVSVSAYCKGDPWEKYYLKMEDVDNRIIPVGCVLTMVGTGSEMNGGAVITNHAQKLKIGHVFGENVFPRFAILNPEFTYTLPKYQMTAGIFDVMSHILEQYLSGSDDNTSDYLAEGLIRSPIASSLTALDHPTDYEARSNIMWTATWALNTLMPRAKPPTGRCTCWGRVGAHTDATHGMTLSAVSGAYYRFILPYGLPKFRRFAISVWGVDPAGKSDEQVAAEGLSALEAWQRRQGLAMNLKELGFKADMLPAVADSTLVMTGGYKTLTREDILEVLASAL